MCIDACSRWRLWFLWIKSSHQRTKKLWRWRGCAQCMQPFSLVYHSAMTLKEPNGCVFVNFNEVVLVVLMEIMCFVKLWVLMIYLGVIMICMSKFYKELHLIVLHVTDLWLKEIKMMFWCLHVDACYSAIWSKKCMSWNLDVYVGIMHVKP